MRPFFTTGQDFKDFQMKVLNDEFAYSKLQNRYEQEYDSEVKKKNFATMYLIKYPHKSKFLPVWNILYLMALLTTFTLVPYTAATNIDEVLRETFIFELVVDFIFLVQIMMSFTTAYSKENDWVDDPKDIAKKYVRDSFFIDFFTTVPTLLTWYMTPAAYYLKFLRMVHISTSQKILKEILRNLVQSQYLTLSKQSLMKLDYFLSILVLFSVMMHCLACAWIWFGQQTPYSWITHPVYGVDAIYGDEAKRDLYYITAFYWAVMTLATVGYGDVKGYTWQEYCFNMFVEFIGIAFFSFVMGSINSIFMAEPTDLKSVAQKLEQVDVWLVNLDNSRASKSLPKILYVKTRMYIEESLENDHKKLIDGYEFLN